MKFDKAMRATGSSGRRMGRPLFLTTLLGATACSFFLDTPVAAAQESARATGDDTIIVTAQRREEALEDVPMTVSVISGEQLGAAGLTSLRDIQNVTTGFQLGQGGGYPQPAIRGVTTVINGTFENNVAVYIDGFYQIAPQGISIDLPNVDNIQILKGPQGTLYGRNATGGAILLQTITPDDSWRGKVEGTYARFQDVRIGGYFAGPLNDKLGVSAAGYRRRSDNYNKLMSRTVPGETDGHGVGLEQDSIRLKLKADLGKFNAILGYNYTHTQDPRGSVYSPIENVTATYSGAGGATRPTKLGQWAYDNYGFTNAVSTWQNEFTLTARLDTGIGTLSSYTGYSIFRSNTLFDFDGSYVQTSYNTSKIKDTTFQQTLDYSIDAIENVDLIIGGTYLKDHLRTQPDGLSTSWSAAIRSDPTVPPPFSNLAVSAARFFAIKKEAWAAYADLTFHPSDRISLNVGGRYSSEVQRSSTEHFNRAGDVTLPFVEVREKFSKFTPRASVRYELGPRTNVYASYSKGFRSGAFPTFPPVINAGPDAAIASWIPAKQETVDAFEVGFKTASRKLRFDLAGFYYDYKDLQVSVTQTFGNPPTPLVFLTNAPKAEIYGIEGSFDYEVFENFTVRGGAAWLHARFGDGAFVDGVGVDPSRPGINTNSDPLKTYLNISQSQDLSGLQLSRAPNFSGNLGFDYLIPRGEGGVRFYANVKYTDSYVPTNPSIWGPLVAPEFQRKHRFVQSGYALVNGSITWTDPTGRYYARIWGNNLTDERYRLHYSGTAAFGTNSPMAEPRTYGITLGFTFGD